MYIRIREVGAKIHLNGTSKVNRHTDRQTDKHTYGQIDLWKSLAQRADALKMSKNRLILFEYICESQFRTHVAIFYVV